MHDLIFRSATSLSQAIRAKEISSEELVRACLERIEAVNGRLNAVVQITGEAALEKARGADAALARGEVTGPLHGVPMTIKDSLETAGVVSTAGTVGRAEHVPQINATVVDRLIAAGAILLGKTNVPEITLRFKTDNNVYGRTNNPYDLDRSPGGSSGGAAAIVAAGGAPFDIGSDTAGSIRIPSAFCGLAGLKPTRGRVPRTGHMPFLHFGALEALTQLGPIARHVEDLGLLLSVISGPDGRDPYAVPVPPQEPAQDDLSGLRVALYTDQGPPPTTPETKTAVEAASTAVVERGASATEEILPVAEEATSMWQDLFGADGGAGVRELLAALGTSEMHHSLSWTQKGEEMGTAEFARLLTRWSELRSEALRFMGRYDLIVCPVNAFPAPLHEEPTLFRFTHPYNLLGWPVAVVRCGESPEGLPIGVQIVGRPFEEATVLAGARAVESALGGWRPPPL